MKATTEYEVRYEEAKARYGSAWNYYDKKDEWLHLSIENDQRAAVAVCPDCGTKGGHKHDCIFH